jgi:hypothetical protein
VKRERGPKLIRNVVRIWEVPGGEISGQEDIKRLVEFPLRRAVKILVDKGIKTSYSTANPKYPFAKIGIDPKVLLPANLEIARTRLGFNSGSDEHVLLECSITPNTSVKKVERYFVKLAKRFSDQKEG